MSARSYIGGILAAIGLALVGCPSPPRDTGRMPPPLDVHYEAGAPGLRKLWSDILAAAVRDDRQRVHTLMASLTMSDEDLDALFGVERARFLRPRYLPMIATLVNIGSMELVAQVSDRKYDDVEVFSIDANGSEIDRATIAALPPNTPVFGVRVKRKEKRQGLRYDFFVYRNGHFVTGNLIGKYLVDRR